ncbi:hypothetical protein K8Z61_07980 [Nocardioides sp. TRM66260-LWL]|uniref:hypothetical protein n=1 Tax=Nocardioides sp. TRM66260-LWL TaxID=2874478 RepID=UPI001CC599E6|nr:hypothetical protein [Nocardioides sp. TRM66260-LWL]MBZ5734433.1 hypothetical protein [Nocardioides sp. TRM66260-LWL]
MSGSVLTTWRAAPVRDGETLHVGDGGLVEVQGGRIVVGSGGLVRVTGPARVSLVDDGQHLLDARPPARAVLMAGDLVADGGQAWAGPDVGWRLTGTAEVTPLLGATRAVVHGSPPRREVLDGRLVRRNDEERDADEVWAGLVAGARPERPDAVALPAEPVDLTAWSGPLLDALRAVGARSRRGGVERPDRVDVLLRCADPGTALARVAADLALPPGLVLHRDLPEADAPERPRRWTVVSDLGLRLVLAPRRGRSRRRRTRVGSVGRC